MSDDDPADLSHAERNILRIGRLLLRVELQKAWIDESPATLSHTEFQVLAFLVARCGHVCRRGEILNGIHGERHAVSDRAIDMQIVGLRRKLAASDVVIETIRGQGFLLREAETVTTNVGSLR